MLTGVNHEQTITPSCKDDRSLGFLGGTKGNDGSILQHHPQNARLVDWFWRIIQTYPPPFGIIGDANQTNLPLNITNYSQHVITNLVANYKLFSTYSYNLPLVTQLMLRMSTRTWGIFFYARTLECLSPWMPGDGSIQNHQPEGVCLFCLTCLWNMTCKLLAKPCKSCNGGLTLHQT